MTDLIRWHTEPEETPFTGYSSSTGRRQKELSELINSNSTRPLYWEIQDKLSSPLSREDQEWLQSIGDAFDSYVIKILNGLHIRPWDFDYNIRKEYELEYGVFPPTDLPLRGVMGRLMSYKEIWNYVYESQSSAGVTDWFWRRPQTEPIWTLDCISGGYRNEKTQPFRTVMTGLNPRDLRRAYEVVLERPWTSRLDPVHHWGVYIDQGDNYYKDDPVRILMACCAEHVGHTDGCWIALRGDPTALEGVVKPYQVFPYVFRNVWETGAIPSEDAIKRDVVWGTAFKDYARYELLHNRIQAGLDAAAKAIRSGYGKYQTLLQTAIDTTEDDESRDRRPYESDSVLSDSERESIASVIRLQYEFNAIQCIGEMPLMADYVNKHIFKVSDMLVHFTYDKKGGLLLSTGQRLKMLSEKQLETLQRLNSFKTLIRDAVADPKQTTPVYLNSIFKSVEAIETRINEIRSAQGDLDEINRLNNKLLSLGSNPPQWVFDKGFDWNAIMDVFKSYETVQTEIIQKQKEINKTVRSLKPSSTQPILVSDVITAPQPIPTTWKTDKVEFDKRLDAALLLEETKKLPDDSKIPLKIDFPSNPHYVDVVNSFEKIQSLKQTVVTVKQAQHTSQVTSAALADFDTRIKTIFNNLRKTETALKRRARLIRYINASKYSDAAKNFILSGLSIKTFMAQNNAAVANAETDILQAKTTYEAVITAEDKKYEDAQKKIKTDVIQELGLVDGNTIISKPDDVNLQINNLFEIAEKLKPLDEWNQTYLGYNKTLAQIKDNLVAAVPSAQAQAYVDAWNGGNRNLMAAAAALANAMKDLLNGLNVTKNKDEISDILKELKDKSELAYSKVETLEQRAERLKREQEEKDEAEEKRQRLERERLEQERLEQERLAREQLAAQDKQILEANKKKYAQLDAWIKMQGNVFYAKSDTGLSEKDGLNADDLKNRYTKEEMSWPFFKDGKKLPIEFDVGQLPRTQFPYTKLYLENTTNTIIEQAWKAFGEYVLYKGTSQENAKKEYLKLLLGSYQQALPDQPVYVLDEWIEVDLQKFPKEFNALKMPQDSAFHTKTIVWNLNSCWIDSSFLALFAYPGNILTEHIMTRGKGYFKQRTIVWENNPTPLGITDGCDEQALKNLHLTIVDDIQRIENPLPANPVCPLKTRDEWSKCVVGPLEIDTKTGKAKGPYSLASNVLWTMKQIYKMDDFEIDEDSALDATGALLSTVTVNANPNTRVYAFNTLYQDGANDLRENLVVLDNDPEFQLGAIISGSGGHFVTYLYDFIQEEWMFINVDKELSNSTWRRFKEGLPTDVHNIKTADFKPYIYLYFKRTDITNLKLRNVTPPVDLYIYTSGMGDTWVKRRWEKSIKPWLNTNFQKLNLDITHYDGVLSPQDLLKFPPQEKAIAQYLKFPQNHVSNEDDAQKTTVVGKIIEFNTLEGVQKNRYVFFDFAHILSTTDPENSNRYTYVAYPYIFGESTFPHLDIFPPFSLDATMKRPKTYIERLIRNEYPVNDTNITLEGNKGVIQVKAIEGVKTQIQYFYFLTIVRYFNLIELAKQLDLDGAKTKLRNAEIFTYDEVNGAKSIIPAPTPTPAPEPTLTLPWDSPFKNSAPEDILASFTVAKLELFDWARRLGIFDNVQQKIISDAKELSTNPALRYAYYHFSLWISEGDARKKELLEIKMRKALVAGEEIPDENDLNLLNIKRYPDDLRKTNLIRRNLLEDFKKKPTSPEQRDIRKRIFGTRFQIDFSELEK